MIFWFFLACNSEQVGKDKVWKSEFNRYCYRLQQEEKQMQKRHDSFLQTFQTYKNYDFTGEKHTTTRMGTVHLLCRDLAVRNKFFMDTEFLHSFFDHFAPPAHKEAIQKEIGREPILLLLGQYCGLSQKIDMPTITEFFAEYQIRSSESQTILRKSIDACKPIMNMSFEDMDWSR